jgi:hypothetical protein
MARGTLGSGLGNGRVGIRARIELQSVVVTLMAQSTVVEGTEGFSSVSSALRSTNNFTSTWDTG